MAARVMATAMRGAGKQQQRGRLQQGWRANVSDEGGGNGNIEGITVGDGHGDKAGGQ